MRKNCAHKDSVRTSVARIGFAGTDARTLLSAYVVSTATSERSEEKFDGVVIRGTPGMQAYANAQNWPVRFVPTIDSTANGYVTAIINAFERGELDYVIPMPEGLLADGIVDKLIAAGFGDRVAGLTREGARLESDKIFCKWLCKRAGIPVADKWLETDVRDYETVLETCLYCINRFGGAVLKYPYMAAGKGARVITNPWEVRDVYETLLHDYGEEYKRIHGNGAPWPLLIESRMAGFEISFTVFVDDSGNFQILPTALDYPERFAGPAGKDNPITGGMGSISPHPLDSAALREMAGKTIIKPLLAEMKRLGILRPCVIYPGCFANFGPDKKPVSLRVCEINIRPGEPEFQVVARRLRNLGALCRAMLEGSLDIVAPEVRENQIAMTLALVTGPSPDSRGYPWRCTRGERLEIDARYLEKNKIFLALSGADCRNGEFISDGTRVAYLLANASFAGDKPRATVAAELRKKLLLAYSGGKVRVVPRENISGNRLAIREDVGRHYEIAESLFGTE